MTRKEFADHHGIGLSTLSKWLHQERLGHNPAVSFQEVVLPTPAPRWGVKIVSPQGWTSAAAHRIFHGTNIGVFIADPDFPGCPVHQATGLP